MRVPRNTHAPLRLPGMLSTAGHCDQSRFAMIYALSLPGAVPNDAQTWVGRSRRASPTLLPVLKCLHAYTDQIRKLRLRKAGSFRSEERRAGEEGRTPA